MAQNTRKPFGGRGFAPDPTEGAYRAPANPVVGVEGLAVPSPRTTSPALGNSGLASPTPLQNYFIIQETQLSLTNRAMRLDILTFV